jgi:nicotinate dehydrogenase large molybdopterin subunit
LTESSTRKLEFHKQIHLKHRKVRYMGEPVAAVAAVDPATARAAVRLIDVVYEELPAVFTPEDAMADGAPLLHENLEDYVMR